MFQTTVHSGLLGSPFVPYLPLPRFASASVRPLSVSQLPFSLILIIRERLGERANEKT